MPKIAVIQFPGFNCEHETQRIIRAAGMECDLFRWNDDYKKLADYDGYVIPGGFSYEDRGRAGLIASLDPAMDELIAQANEGKPLLGICNGAQVLMETGLIPGAPDRNLLMSLARNKRVKDGRILGTGFYNAWVHIKTSAERGRTPFNFNIDKDEIWAIPVAHGEGRFTTTNTELLDELISNDQIIFQYCDEDGNTSDQFPINPNGALHNMTALSNPAGNVMGIMPHPERGFTAPTEAIFNSMADWFNDKRLHKGITLDSSSAPVMPEEHYKHPENTLEFIVELKITDNEAESLHAALKRKGFDNLTVERYVHYELEYKNVDALDPFIEQIESSGELFNPNKESHHIQRDTDEPLKSGKTKPAFAILVRDREDFAGQSKAYNLKHHLGEADHIQDVKRGTLWLVTVDDTPEKARETFDQILATNIFYNHHAQTVVWY
jgi:phosphoribosylformylglycinamidine synthase